MEDGEAKAKYYYEKVAPAMEALRAPVESADDPLNCKNSVKTGQKRGCF